MTRITLLWGDQGLLGLESQGHSGKNPKGENVICAAVSALVHALLLGLLDVAELGEDVTCEVDDSVPLIRVEWTRDRARELDLLTRTVALSLKEIASGYAGHVNVSEVHRT